MESTERQYRDWVTRMTKYTSRLCSKIEAVDYFTVKNEDAFNLINKIEGRHRKSFLYLDPPYNNQGGFYTHETKICDTIYRNDGKKNKNINFQEFARVLSLLKNPFLLSINKDDDIKRWFEPYGFQMNTFRIKYSASSNATSYEIKEEYLISNFVLEEKVPYEVKMLEIKRATQITSLIFNNLEFPADRDAASSLSPMDAVRRARLRRFNPSSRT
jgi:hypothetical protein